MTSVTIDSGVFDDDEPSAEELAAIERGEDPFADPVWSADAEVEMDYPGADYDYDCSDPYDTEYDVP